MTDNSDRSWDRVHESLAHFVSEFAEEIVRYGTSVGEVLRWRAENPGRYVIDKAREILASPAALGRAFHLDSFANFRSAVYRSPAGRWVGSSIGPRSQPYVLNVEDFAFRTAEFAIKLLPDGDVSIDPTVVANRVRDLSDAVVSPTATVEILTLLRRLWLRGELLLGSDVQLRRLSDDEVIDLITLGMVAPRLRFDRFNDRPTGEVEVQESERVALVRYVQEPNLTRAGVTIESLDAASIVRRDVERLGDAIALLESTPIEIVGWRSRGAGTVLAAGGSGYQVLQPLGPPPFVQRSGFNIDLYAADFSKKWTELEHAEADPHGATVRLAVRRIGLSIGRGSWEDRLIDGIVALEALLLEREDRVRGIGGMLAQRVPALWPSVPPNRLAHKIKQAYHARDAVVHGNAIPAEHVEGHAKLVLEVARVISGRRLDMRQATGSYTIDWETRIAEYRAKFS